MSETITCPRCRGGTRKIEDPCNLCNGSGKAPRNKIYKNLGCGILHFYMHNNFGIGDCLWAFKRDNPNIKITSVVPNFVDGVYAARIYGYTVITDN